MANTILDFEKPFVELDEIIQETQKRITDWNPKVKSELRDLKRKRMKLYREIYPKLTPWQRTQLARHPERPYSSDYIAVMCKDSIEIHGDRRFSDDHAIMACLTKMDGTSLVVIAQQKGRGTKENIYRNFGMSGPEGYRKALRAMLLAEKFGCPILTMIDTPGAYPGIGAEERGQAEAIAKNLFEMARLKVPIISLVIGEGGSGGALGIGLADRILMLENSIYSVISPEACAAILWKNREKALDVAGSLKMTAQDLINLNIIDEVVKEPLGGAHRDYNRAAHIVRRVIRRHLAELQSIPVDELVAKRYEKYRGIGVYREA
jgi:acetyl-CoA carboxylase carboxyl transferase subunit alpha